MNTTQAHTHGKEGLRWSGQQDTIARAIGANNGNTYSGRRERDTQKITSGARIHNANSSIAGSGFVLD